MHITCLGTAHLGVYQCCPDRRQRRESLTPPGDLLLDIFVNAPPVPYLMLVESHHAYDLCANKIPDVSRPTLKVRVGDWKKCSGTLGPGSNRLRPFFGNDAAVSVLYII